MSAGLKNKLISIESLTRTVDSVGDSIETWSTFATAWVEIKTESGREFQHAREQHSELSHVLSLRYLSGITSKMRINIDGDYYNILSVFDPSRRKSELRIYCSEQL